MSEVWYEQSNEFGDIFFDQYLHRECEFINVHKSPPWNREGIKEQNKEEDE